MNPIKKFQQERAKNIEKQIKSKRMNDAARSFLTESLKYKYSYDFDWLGRPIIQYPQDIIAMQEIIWETKPDLIIEIGIAHGGGLIFYASMIELIGRGKVLGVDIDIREHNRKEIEKHRMFKRVRMIEGSSVDKNVVRQVAEVVRKHNRIMVCLDSLHTHQHVLRELDLYSKFVSKGSYLVVFDTYIEQMPKGFYKDRPWDKGNNPATAVEVFLKKNTDFVVDRNIENKLLITVAPGGYLKRIK